MLVLQVLSDFRPLLCQNAIILEKNNAATTDALDATVSHCAFVLT